MEFLPFFLEDDEELLAYNILKKKCIHNLERGSQSFTLDSFTDDFCWVHFRFYKDDLGKLRQALGIPDKIKCSNSLTVDAMEALCILLKRLAYPNRYADLMKYFPRTRCELSRVFNKMVTFVLTQHGHLLADLNWLKINDLKECCTALQLKGCPYKNCFGFLDGTIRPICRPRKNQRDFYNGHKRVNALKLQSMILPNGLIGLMYGPVHGRRHDAFLLQASQLIHKLQQFNYPQPMPYYLYGDPAYPLLPELIIPFRGHGLTPVQRKCNRIMSGIRESVEWGFGKIIQIFSFLVYKKNLKIGLQPVGNYYLVGAILTNCHTCLYGSETTTYFNFSPPDLNDYLN